MFVDKCSICCEINDSIKKLITYENSGLNYLEKLKYIAPEVEWCDDHLICDKCTADLIVACQFKERCLNVQTSSLKQEAYSENHDIKSFYENDNSISTDNEDDQCDLPLQTFICYNCEISFENKIDLSKHIEQEHKEKSDGSNVVKYKRKEECSKCGRKFTLSTSLKEHFLICDGVSRHRKIYTEYQCDRCNKYYTTEKILNAHKKKCKLEGIKVTKYQCTKCNSYYISAKTLRDHKRRGCKKDEHIEEVVCKFCHGSFKSFHLLKKHITDTHTLNSCDLCDMKFDCEDLYNIHKKEKHNKKDSKARKFNCEICDESFILIKTLIEHCMTVHSMDEKSVKPYLCEVCKHRFKSSTNLVTHRLYHNRIRTNICTVCGKSFITKNDLLAHESTHYTLRKYKCTECEKAFKTNTNLRTHCLIVHTDPSQWKYVCRICNKRFPQKSNHDQHLRRHIGEKNFHCPLCKKAFTSKSEMQGHVSFHSNERPHKCTHCGKEYRKRHTYTVHMAKVHGIGNAKIRVRERKYACHICPGKFQDRLKLARHLCTHTGSKPFPCYACDKKFTDKSYLKHHLKTFHNIVELKQNLPVCT